MTAQKTHLFGSTAGETYCGRATTATTPITHLADQITCANCLKALAEFEARQAESDAAVAGEVPDVVAALGAPDVEYEVPADFVTVTLKDGTRDLTAEVAIRNGLDRADVDAAIAAGWLKH